ncbi:MAG: hypothetical protein IT572_01560 [Deltaproteobacteria bacterium]|nr:hypothetical protein [Deltaproteobacteria bacterium]
MEFGIEAFHRGQTALRLIQDNGDGLPGPHDHYLEIWSGKEAGVDPKALLRLGAWARDYHRQGLPIPPQIRIFQPVASGPDKTPGGSYRAETDTLSLPTDAGPDAWAHEWSHFLLDGLNDQNGLNSTFYEPNYFLKLDIFDPNRCSTWESLSVYAGTCDRERRGTAMAGSKKAAEDPAETLAAVLEAGRDAALPSTLHLNLTEVYFLQKLQVAVYWSETEDVEIAPAELRELRKTALDFHRHLGRDVPAPPAPDPKISTRESLLDLAAWVRRLESEILPQAKRRRQEKLVWARGLLEALRPSDPNRGFPDPSRWPELARQQPLDFGDR